MTTADGEVVWTHATGGVYLDYLVRDVVLPFQSKSMRADWDQAPCQGPVGTLPPGTYVARGAWIAWDDDTGDEAWWSPPVRFEIRGS